MYVYDCNFILTTAMKNRSEKDIKIAFTSLNVDLKTQGFNPGYHFMDNEASTSIKRTLETISIKYQLVTPSNHISNNTEREIQTFENYFIVGMCSSDK